MMAEQRHAADGQAQRPRPPVQPCLQRCGGLLPPPTLTADDHIEPHDARASGDAHEVVRDQGGDGLRSRVGRQAG